MTVPLWLADHPPVDPADEAVERFAEAYDLDPGDVDEGEALAWCDDLDGDAAYCGHLAGMADLDGDWRGEP